MPKQCLETRWTPAILALGLSTQHSCLNHTGTFPERVIDGHTQTGIVL